jgi:hypothetical protein
MSGHDDDAQLEDLVEQYLLFLRGRGPEPDLSGLPSDRRTAVREQLKILAALADRYPEPPPFDEDPVAIRLGLVDHARSERTSEPGGGFVADDDPVAVALHDLAFRFGGRVTVDFAPAWAAQTPAGMRPVAQCTALGEVVAVFVADVEGWQHEPGGVAGYLWQCPDVSAVGLASEDAERAVLLTAADASRSVDPVRGWLAPRNPARPEPLGIVLGRHFDGRLPQWERVAELDELLDLGNFGTVAGQASAVQLAEAQRAKPRLAHKREALKVLENLDPSAVATVVVEVQSGRLAGERLVDRVAQLAAAGTP